MDRRHAAGHSEEQAQPSISFFPAPHSCKLPPPKASEPRAFCRCSSSSAFFNFERLPPTHAHKQGYRRAARATLSTRAQAGKCEEPGLQAPASMPRPGREPTWLQAEQTSSSSDPCHFALAKKGW